MRRRVFGIEKFKGLLLAGSFATVIEFLMGLSDSVIAGHRLGESALAGINLLSPVMTSVTFVAGLIGVGMGINYSLESGRLNRAGAHRIFTQGLWTVLIIGSTLLAALALLREPFLAFMAPGAEIAAHARAYWMWYFPSALMEPLAILLVNVCYADGDSRLCMTTYVVQMIINIGVALATVGSMGTAGCALGTFVSNGVAIAILSTHFLRRTNTFRLVRHFDVRDTLRILKTSFGDSSSFLCTAGLFFFLNKYVIAKFGAGYLPVLSTVIATIGFLEIFNGVGTALAPIVTVYVGEGNTRAVRLLMRVADRLAAVEGLALTLVLGLFPQLVVKLVGIDDPALVGSACTAVRVTVLGLVFTSFVYLYNSYYLFIGRETLAVALTVVNGFLAPVICVLALGGLGLSGVWSALACAPALSVTGFTLYLGLRHGRSMLPLLLPRERDEKIHLFDLSLDDGSITDTSRRVASCLKRAGVGESVAMRAALMTEEVFMAVKDRNGAKRVLAEATLDLNDGVTLTLRDDGEIFDITDADQQIASLRTFLVASVMEHQKAKVNLVTTGFNRNVFKFEENRK